MHSSAKRWIGLTGLLFVVLLAASVFVLPSPPNTHASAAKVVSYYHDHKSAVEVCAYLIDVAIFVGLFFFWYLRDLLSNDVQNRRLMTIAFAGAVVFAVSGALASGLYWASADSVGHLDPSGLQLLNVMQTDVTGFMLGGGAAAYLVATGGALVRGNVLPKWLGWLGIVFGVLTLAVPEASGPLPVGVWLLVASIVLLASKSAAAAESSA